MPNKRLTLIGYSSLVLPLMFALFMKLYAGGIKIPKVDSYTES